MDELRPGARGILVDDGRTRLPVAMRKHLKDAVGLPLPYRGIEERHFAHAGIAVVPRDDADDLAVAARHRSRVHHGIGVPRVGAVKGLLPRPVGVHGEEDAAEVVRGVVVLPCLLYTSDAADDLTL